MTVVFPKAGIGTGVCRLEDVAPLTALHLRRRLTELKTIPGATTSAK